MIVIQQHRGSLSSSRKYGDPDVAGKTDLSLSGKHAMAMMLLPCGHYDCCPGSIIGLTDLETLTYSFLLGYGALLMHRRSVTTSTER